MNDNSINELIILGAEYMELYNDDTLGGFLKWLKDKPRETRQYENKDEVLAANQFMFNKYPSMEGYIEGL